MSTTTKARAPRELEPSQGLLRVLDKCDGATVTGLHGRRRSSPEVSLAALERIKSELDLRLDDDILVVMALGAPVIRLLSGIEDVKSIADAEDERLLRRMAGARHPRRRRRATRATDPRHLGPGGTRSSSPTSPSATASPTPSSARAR